MKRRVNRNRPEATQRHDGFTLLQAMIVLTVAMIVSGATVLSIRAGRPYLQLANSAHTLAGYLERARADSVRRRPIAGQESSVQILDDRTYRVTMGFGGSGTLSSRDITLEGLVRFKSDAMTVAFDWRGRPTSGKEATFLLENENFDPMQVDVTGSGDVTVGSEIYQDDAIPNINLNENVSGDVAPDPLIPPDPLPTESIPETDQNPTPTPPVNDNPTPTPTPHGNPNPGDGNPHNSPSPTATPTPTPSPSPSPSPQTDPNPNACLATISSPTLTIKRNGGFDIVTVATTGQAGTVTVSAPRNLTVSPSNPPISFAGTVVFTIRSNNGSRGVFTVTFTTPCGKVSTAVTVGNN